MKSKKAVIFLFLCAATFSFSAVPNALGSIVLETADGGRFQEGSRRSLSQAEEQLSDVEAYRRLFFHTRTARPQSADYKMTPWRDDAIGYVMAWAEFIERYSDSRLVPQAYIRMAEWYLTIKRGDDRLDWGKKNEDPNAVKDDPELLEPVYRNEALKLLSLVINNFPNYDHLSDVGGGELVYNDKVGAVALYTRAMFFPAYCKSDLARLEREFSGLPSTIEAVRFLSKKCDYKRK